MIRYEISKILEKILMKITRTLPRKLKYWVVIDLWAYHSVHTWPSKTPDEITWSMMAKRLESDE